MKYSLNLAEDNRILSATFAKHAGLNAVLVNALPDGDISDYLYQNGEYIYSPLPVAEVTEVPSESEDTAAMLIDHEYRLTLLELGLSE